MSDTRTLTTDERLPENIERKLRSMVRRARFVMAVRGACPVVTVLVLGLLLVMAVDATVTFMPLWPRWAMTLAILAVTATATVVFLIRPLARSMTLEGIARALEARHPELQERISSAVELLRSGDAGEAQGSRALIAALVEEASHDVEGLLPRQEVTLRSARPFLLAAALSLALLAGLLAVRPRESSRLLARAVAPFLNLPNVAAYELSVTPGDTTIRPGDSLRVEVEVANERAGAATLYLINAQGQRSVLEMDDLPAPEGSQKFAALCPPPRQGFQYRIRAGDALTRYYRVNVVPPPIVHGMNLRLEYPDYGYLEPVEESPFAGEVSGVEGTRVTITARLNKSVPDAGLYLKGRDDPFARGRCHDLEDGGAECLFKFALEAGLTGTWWLEATDEHGFTNTREVHAIETVPDSPPRVRVAHPRRRQMRCRPADTIPVLYALRDDLGIAAAEMLLTVDGGEAQPTPIALPPEGPERLSIVDRTSLDLSRPELEGAREVRFQLRATDALPPDRGGPQEDLSRIFTVLIQPEAPPYAEQVLTLLEEDVREVLEGVKEELQTAKAGSEKLREALDGESPPPDDMPEQLRDMMEHLVAAERSTRDLEARVEDGTYDALAPRLRELADEHIVPAEDGVEEVALSETPEDREAQSEATDQRIESAIAATDELLEEFEEMAEAMERLEALREAAAMQEELARQRARLEEQPEAAAMTPEDWDAAQQELTAQVGDMVEQTPSALQMQAELQAERMRDLAGEARRLEEQQTDLASDTETTASLPETDEELEELAREQRELAERAGSRESTAGQQDDMAEAAEDIRSGKLREAVRQQSQSEGSLRNEAARLAIDEFEQEARQKAHELAQRQRELAEQVAGEQESEGDGPQRAAQRQKQVRAEAGELAESLTDASPQAQRAINRHNPLDEMRQAEEALSGDDSEQAQQAAATAAEEMERLAAALDELPREADWMSRLAKQQRDLRARTQALADSREAAREGLQETLMSRLSRDQAEVARQAEELARRVTERRPQEDRLEERAAEESQRAADNIQAGRLPQATTDADEAAEDLGELAQRLDAANRRDATEALEAGDPSRTDEVAEARRLADDAARVAEQQERLADQMRALAEGGTVEALEARQRHLREATSALGEETSRLQEPFLPFLGPDEANQAAAEATSELSGAMQSQQTAESALGEQSPEEAVPAQTDAAGRIGRAAEALDRMSEAYAQAAGEELAESAIPAEEGQSLGQAYQATAQAAAGRRSADAAVAAGRLAAAAARTRGRMSRMGLQPYSLDRQIASEAGMRGPARDPHSGPRNIPFDPTARQLGEADLTLDDWARLPSELRNDIMQAADHRGPEEYRDLIRRYFRELARMNLDDANEEESE
ncbi:MAG: hypothetical protein R6X33_05190 [Candidatus Brocadiia bacterium]